MIPTGERVASPELDAEVAERVLGWTNIHFHEDRFFAGDVGKPPPDTWRRINPKWATVDGSEVAVPNYSTDLVAAWQVIETLVARGYFPHIVLGETDSWLCFVTRRDRVSPLAARSGATAPLAICRMALEVLHQAGDR